MVYLDSLQRVVLRKAGAQHPFDLVVHDQHVVYTDWVMHAVIRINKYTGEDMVMLRQNIPRPMSLIAVSNQSLECEKNPCSILNGGCEDICSISKKGQAICSCHPGRFIIEDGKRCSFTNLQCDDQSEFQCSQSLTKNPICIPYNLTCDGIPHCPDESDEDVRYCAIRDCKPGFFQCANNKCILQSGKCNGKCRM